jgi:hypothetical protein
MILLALEGNSPQRTNETLRRFVFWRDKDTKQASSVNEPWACVSKRLIRIPMRL